MGRKFSSNIVGSLLTGRLWCQLDQLYDVASYVVGRSVYTHEIPEVVQLANREWPEMAIRLNKEATSIEDYKEKIRLYYGDEIELHPIGADKFDNRDPRVKLGDMVENKRVIVINKQEGRADE